MSVKILVVDDSSLARRTVRNIVEQLGHHVEEANDGAQAIERYFLNRHDLVILDMVMTGMYGTEVLAKLREINPQIRVIVSTADIQTSTREQVRAGGASAMLNKPVNRDQLSQLIAKVLAGGDAWN